MLAALSIRDIVLIDRLDLEFEPGLVVMSGETGAGKSIVLDALALALGARGESGLVRAGVGQGSVTASFTVDDRARFDALLGEHGLAPGDEIVLRRVQHGDGRTRAFVNDEPVSVALMRDLGRALVEIHGQHDERALLEPATHLALVDVFAGHGERLTELGALWAELSRASEALAAHEDEMARASADADYLRHACDELSALAPEAGEEERLAGERQLMMAGERIAEDLALAADALGGEAGAETAVARALAAVERAAARAGDLMSATLDALERTRAELGDAMQHLAQAQHGAEADPARLETVEERLFALRAAARKHNVAVDALPELAERLAARLATIDSGEATLAELREEADRARAAYLDKARELSRLRREAGVRLDREVEAELGPLRLESARFETAFETLDEARAGPAGLDRAEFLISANPGTPLGPLRKVASGGELARVMLAIKVVLAGLGGAPTLIFDEIDSGVGGAVADAVGERLQRLGGDLQVIVVTHSPQVAARGHDHLLIEKDGAGGDSESARTLVRRLDDGARREEIARMLAGARVTEEARAAAGRLIGGAAP